MRKRTLLVVAPDDHYVKKVAAAALRKGLIAKVLTSGADFASFSAAMNSVDKDNLIIAKGLIETADFLRLIIKYNERELIAGGREGFLSHCIVVRKNGFLGLCPGRPLIMTDVAINIAPTPEKKVRIASYAVDFAKNVMGIENPVLSVLTPSGKLNPSIKSSVDGDFVIKNLPDVDARLDQLDTAISERARRVKGLPGGAADILLVDNLDTGNSVLKAFTVAGSYDAAGFVVGTTVPIVLNSRSDPARSKLWAIKIAAKSMAR